MIFILIAECVSGNSYVHSVLSVSGDLCIEYKVRMYVCGDPYIECTYSV